MADKYLRHGATYCGDGTTSALAASAGAAGAWNNKNILETNATTPPAYGVLAAGDRVFIRSKDEAGNNLALTLTASINLGSASATVSAPITWILDGGAVWPGINGTLTYSCPSTYLVGLRNYNKYRADVPEAWSIVETNAAAEKTYGSGVGTELENILVDLSFATTSFGCSWGYNGGISTFKGCRFRLGRHRMVSGFFQPSFYGLHQFIGTNIELTVVDNNQGVFDGDTDNHFEFIGGGISGVGATTGKTLFWSLRNSRSISMIGFSYPKTMTLFGAYSSVYPTSAANIAAADGVGGGTFFGFSGEARSRIDAYYPTLSATLPNSTGTPWSWFIYPSRATKVAPMQMTSSLVYTAAAAVNTVTLELLVSDDFTSLNRSNLYMHVTYIDDSTGLAKCVSSQLNSATALDSSTAPWTAGTYSDTFFDKRKLTVTTPTSIKQDTIVSVILSCEQAAASLVEVYIMNPDFSIAA